MDFPPNPTMISATSFSTRLGSAYISNTALIQRDIAAGEQEKAQSEGKKVNAA
jgi:hypothetical protein